MALILILMSSLVGLIASVVALFGFDVSWSQALALYLVASIVPTALIMAGAYVQVLLAHRLSGHEAQARAHSQIR